MMTMNESWCDGVQWTPEQIAAKDSVCKPLSLNRTASSINLGDRITFSDVYDTELNPDRRWWQFWKARTVQTPYLRCFVISDMMAASQGSAPPRQ